MAITQLLTPGEVKTLSRISPHFPSCDLNDICQVELAEARTCLGKEFYAAMLADGIDYSTAADYVSGTTYNTGDVVVYNGIFKQVLDSVATTTQEPNGSDWENAPKFETECYEDLWCKYLGRYLALNVVRNTIPFIATPMTAQGIVKKHGDNFTSASKDEVIRFQKAIDTNIVTAQANMDDYMQSNNSGGCFSLYKGNQNCDSDCGSCCDCFSDSFLNQLFASTGNDRYQVLLRSESRRHRTTCASRKRKNGFVIG